MSKPPFFERDQAREALAAAEADMLRTARDDPKAFARARRRRQAAIETLERLDWAEKAAREGGAS